jgi:hypothetical protein
MLDIMLRIAYLSAIGLSLYTSGWLLMKADKTRTTGALAACQLLIIIWCMPQLFSALPMTKGMKYLAYGISYIGISFIGMAGVCVSLQPEKTGAWGGTVFIRYFGC